MVVSMKRWEGKVAIVTGTSSGIGKAIAAALVEHGLIVAGLARRSDRVAQHAKQLEGKKGKLHAIKTDISCEQDVLDAFEWVTTNLGPVHVLVNNAGVAKRIRLTDGQTKDWKTILDVNVLGLCIATREAIKIMRTNQINGHIIHINSVLGHKVIQMASLNVYPASKYAVTALTETLRQELNYLGCPKIRVTSISPGAVKSEMSTDNKDLSDEVKAQLAKGPILDAEDIADGVVYVLSTPEHVQVHELTIKPVGESF